jgi:hypothetical protein
LPATITSVAASAGTPESTATPNAEPSPVMKFWSTPVPSRLARPIHVDTGAVEIGAADR